VTRAVAPVSPGWMRGISDFGDELKDDRFHAFASRAAAAVLRTFSCMGSTSPRMAQTAKHRRTRVEFPASGERLRSAVPRGSMLAPSHRIGKHAIRVRRARRLHGRAQGVDQDGDRREDQVLCRLYAKTILESPATHDRGPQNESDDEFVRPIIAVIRRVSVGPG